MKTPEDYLKAPYSRVIIPDEEEGGYTAKIMEFPGCISEGDTLDEAYKNLEESAKGWILAALEMGQTIPQPSCENQYGGKVALRMARSLHRQVVYYADQEGVSLNQFIVTAIAEKVGSENLCAAVSARLESRLVSNAITSAVKHFAMASYSITQQFGTLKDVPVKETASTAEQRPINFLLGHNNSTPELITHG